MTLLTKKLKKEDRPAVHALVIGVSHYPYLQDGGKKLMTPDVGLGQLASPIASTEVFCRWLQMELRPRGLPLGSIEVLCSSGGHFEDFAGKAVQVATPSLANVRKAVGDWAERGDQSEDNFMLMYFCGHGVSSGLVNSLLLEDFGKDKNDPFDTGAIDADGLMDGVRSKRAKSQLFLIDACRTVSHTTFAQFGEKRGASIIPGVPHAQLGVVEQACLWATSLGSFAYGLKDKPSVFMSALLHAMRGGGALQDPDDGSWVIQPDILKRAIDHLIQRIPQFANSGLQYTQLDGLSKGLAVHLLEGDPSVPVKVQCVPGERIGVTRFSCSSGDVREVGPEGPWHLDLPCDQYTFEAVAPDGGKTIKTPASPPYSIVSFRY